MTSNKGIIALVLLCLLPLSVAFSIRMVNKTVAQPLHEESARRTDASKTTDVLILEGVKNICRFTSVEVPIYSIRRFEKEDPSYPAIIKDWLGKWFNSTKNSSQRLEILITAEGVGECDFSSLTSSDLLFNHAASNIVIKLPEPTAALRNMSLLTLDNSGDVPKEVFDVLVSEGRTKMLRQAINDLGLLDHCKTNTAEFLRCFVGSFPQFDNYEINVEFHKSERKLEPDHFAVETVP